MNHFRSAIIAALITLAAVGSMILANDNAEVLKTQSMKQIEMLNVRRKKCYT